MSFKKYCLFILPLLFVVSINAQETPIDTIEFKSLNKSKLAFLLDDTYVLGGLTSSGIFFSNNFRGLSYGTGASFGIEQYVPVSGKLFFTGGLNLISRNFLLNTDQVTSKVNNLYLDIPISSAYEIPLFNNLDFRILLGGFVGVRLNSNVSHNFSGSDNSSAFLYEVNDFHRFDFGWLFGVSLEHNNFIFRIKGQTGFVKFDNKDQGMMNSFSFEVGYFLFRKINKK